jgi:hypothetical protein
MNALAIMINLSILIHTIKLWEHKIMEIIVLLLGAVGFLGGIVLWLFAIHKRVDDAVLFEGHWKWKMKKEWFTPNGYKIYVASQIVFWSGLLLNIIYWWFLR